MGVGGKSLKGAPCHLWQVYLSVYTRSRHCLLSLTSWIMRISEAGVPRCGLETKEPGSGASLSTEEKTAAGDGSVGRYKVAQLVLAQPRLRE